MKEAAAAVDAGGGKDGDECEGAEDAITVAVMENRDHPRSAREIEAGDGPERAESDEGVSEGGAGGYAVAGA